ncbi:hypothetical protein, partial [Antrihabitans spumae]
MPTIASPATRSTSLVVGKPSDGFICNVSDGQQEGLLAVGELGRGVVAAGPPLAVGVEEVVGERGGLAVLVPPAGEPTGVEGREVLLALGRGLVAHAAGSSSGRSGSVVVASWSELATAVARAAAALIAARARAMTSSPR